uniref:Variant surface glycoprotein n=1 Tax=Trypanosoma brucei TaxID=5691 RepID=A0A1V0FXT1_9TRYP|nr:variant surface glycoprotein [Trypanosoma brucei]
MCNTYQVPLQNKKKILSTRRGSREMIQLAKQTTHKIAQCKPRCLRPLLVFFCLAVLAAKAQETTTASQAIKTSCQEISFNTKLINLLNGKLADARRRLEELRAESLAFKMAGCLKNSISEALPYHALAALADSRANALQANIATNQQTIETATKRLQTRNGQLFAAMQIKAPPEEPAHVHGTQAGGAIGVAGGTKKCTATTTATPTNTHNCETDTSGDADINAAVGNIRTLKTYKAIDLKELSIGTISAEVVAIGDYDTSGAAATNDGKACGQAGPVALGAVTAGVRIQKLTVASDWGKPADSTIHKTGAEQDCEDETDVNKQPVLTLKAVAYAICTGRKVDINTPNKVGDETISSLHSDPEFQSVATLAMLTPANSEPTPKQKQDAVKELLGDDTKTVHDKFLKPAEANKINFKFGSTTISSGAITLSKHTDYSKAIGFCLGVQYRAAQAEKKEAAPVPETEKTKTCSEEKDETKCNKKNGCEFKEGECKSKAQTTTNTNTTGSNSFVIKKTPLLLAVLLF